MIDTEVKKKHFLNLVKIQKRNSGFPVDDDKHSQKKNDWER